MNLYFLLEGKRTEPQLYRRWLRHALPDLHEVRHVGELTDGGFMLRSAGGYPQILERIRESVADIESSGVPLHQFFVCLDAEEDSYDVSRDDPEDMPVRAGYATRARFHFAYLKAVLRDRSAGRTRESFRYSKRQVGYFGEWSHFRALIERRDETGHLASFGHLLTAWRGLGAEI